MKRNKKIFGYILIFSLVIFIFVYKVQQNKGNLSLENRNIKNNSAEEVILNTEYGVVGKDLNPGFYDIYSNESSGGEIDSLKILPNKEVKSVPLFLNNQIEMKGTLTFKPSKFEKLYFSKDNISIVSNSIYLLVGTNVKEGNYLIWSYKEGVYLTIYKGFLGDSLNEIKISKNKTKVNLKNDEYIYLFVKNPQVNKIFFERVN